MCREFLARDVPQEKIDRGLDLALQYPSAGHTVPQEFIVVRDQRVEENLARAAHPPKSKPALRLLSLQAFVNSTW
jgi:nitroreductase